MGRRPLRPFLPFLRRLSRLSPAARRVAVLADPYRVHILGRDFSCEVVRGWTLELTDHGLFPFRLIFPLTSCDKEASLAMYLPEA